jgi:hypothetical protein
MLKGVFEIQFVKYKPTHKQHMSLEKDYYLDALGSFECVFT